MKREFVVVAIHGEGDRATVNALQAHRNKVFSDTTIPDEPPDVLVVLRDGDNRMDLPLESWAEVEEWKTLAGYDAEKRHWKSGAIVKVTLGG